MKRNKRRWYLLVAVLVAAAVWIGIDLAGPHKSDLREFDPEAVARLETDMWRSYYERRQARLFLQLSQLLRTQYGVPFFRSNLLAFHAAKAAFIFKDGQNRSDYERALPDLVRFYTAIHDMSATRFDVSKAAKGELEWWIIHRERKNHSREEFERTLAELQAGLFVMPAERFLEHGRFRAEAMLIRDEKWAAGGVSEPDWEKIHELLHRSWRALWEAVNHQS